MKEVPFIHHHTPFPLGSSGGTSSASTSTRRFIASLNHNANNNDGNKIKLGEGGAIGVFLTNADKGNNANSYATNNGDNSSSSLALVPVENKHGGTNGFFGTSSNNKQGGTTAAAAAAVTTDSQEESYTLRGSSSIHYSARDNRLVCTNGVAGKRGTIHISIRDAGGSNSGTGGGGSSDNKSIPKITVSDVEVDLSSVMDEKMGGSSLFEGSVGTACFVTHSSTSPSNEDETTRTQDVNMDSTTSADGGGQSSSFLHLRTVDPYGTVLSLSFSYPDMTPILSTTKSFVLPLSPKGGEMNHQLNPHPGSSLELNQVCFPTANTVVFALNPHLYCVDLGDGDCGVAATTRVWTNTHQVDSDPIADSTGGNNGGGSATPTPRKKPRKSLGIIYTLMGMSDTDGSEAYEYDDDVEEGGDGSSHYYGGGASPIPSIAALTNLPSLTTDSDDAGNTARVSTLHSDGSLRIWIADPSQKESNKNQLRIPSVQRIATSSKTSYLSEAIYTDPPIPHPSMWDPSRDALTLRGYCTFDESGTVYEVALHTQCYANGRKDEANKASVYVFQGLIVGADGGDTDETTRALPSGNTTKMQELTLPNGTKSVVDVSWSHDQELMVLLRYSTNDEDGQETFYDIGDEGENVEVKLACYHPLDSGSYANEAVLPTNMTLPYLDLNHCGNKLALSVEEEMDRFMGIVEEENTADEEEYDDMETEGGSPRKSDASSAAQAEAKIDRAGLLAILQPFGRSRPSSLAVYRAMSSLSLLDGDTSLDEIKPVAILSAMRKWKKRAAFQSSTAGFSSALIPVEEESPANTAGGNSPMTSSNSLSIYHAFASATKASRHVSDNGGDNEYEQKSGPNIAEATRQAHRNRWVRLLSEIRRQENQLDGLLCLEMLPSSGNLLVRGSMISVLSISDSAVDVAHVERSEESMAELDELAVDLLEYIMATPDLRQLLCRVESMLYDGASKASSLVDGWSDKGSNIDVFCCVQLLGDSAMASMSLSDAQIRLLSNLAQVESTLAEEWLKSLLSASPYVSTRLAISKPFATMPDTAAAGSDGDSCESDALFSANALISARLESIRQIALSRLILVFGLRHGISLPVQQSALRSILYSYTLSWAIHQPSSVNKKRTVIEEHLSHEMTKDFFHSGMAAGLPLADMFIASAVSYYAGESSGDVLSNLLSPSHEPQVALRLLAPLVGFPSQGGSDQKRREVIAECLLSESSAIVKRGGRSAEGTSPELLWSLASKMLLETVPMESEQDNLINRVELLERHLNLVECNKAAMSLCCGVVLDAIHDALSQAMSDKVHRLWATAFQTAMRGHLWDEALRACISNPLEDDKETSLKTLILGMINAGALGKIVDMSLAVVGSDVALGLEGVDLFDTACKVIESAAVDEASAPLVSSGDDGGSYWGCLYTLHASRGNWKDAANAMDMCGKSTAHSVSSAAKSDSQESLLSKAASKKIMDDACLSAQTCFHSISLIENSVSRYLLPLGEPGVSSETRLLTGDDMERRAARALALRLFSMDEYSPDSIGTILESTSRDTINELAMLGYYDHAIAVALGVSSKRKGLPGGVDLFDDALKYILCTYLVPAATNSPVTSAGVLENLQSRSKTAQFRAASAVCALQSNNDQRYPSSTTISSANSKSSMDLLQQYTTTYSKRCHGLSLYVANTILQVGDGVSTLPLWLKNLCMFGISGESGCGSERGLFAQPTKKGNSIADPAGLMRLFVKHHQYGEACDVVTSILSKQAALKPGQYTSLPEKGSIDWLPYDLIDMLWIMIGGIASKSSTSSEAVKSKIKALTRKRATMETALENHFESLRVGEEGLASSRALAK